MSVQHWFKNTKTTKTTKTATAKHRAHKRISPEPSAHMEAITNWNQVKGSDW